MYTFMCVLVVYMHGQTHAHTHSHMYNAVHIKNTDYVQQDVITDLLFPAGTDFTHAIFFSG